MVIVVVLRGDYGAGAWWWIRDRQRGERLGSVTGRRKPIITRTKEPKQLCKHFCSAEGDIEENQEECGWTNDRTAIC